MLLFLNPETGEARQVDEGSQAACQPSWFLQGFERADSISPENFARVLRAQGKSAEADDLEAKLAELARAEESLAIARVFEEEARGLQAAAAAVFGDVAPPARLRLLRDDEDPYA